MFHEDSDDDVDQDELGHQDEDDEKDGGDDSRDAAILDTISGSIAFLAQRVLHDSVPIVARRYAEQRQEGNAKVGKVRMFAKTLARMFVVAFCVGEIQTIHEVSQLCALTVGYIGQLWAKTFLFIYIYPAGQTIRLRVQQR